ncbi:MAG: aspartate--tRNA ligase [Alphaproteobacteria bacterium]|nr:aspartate--tRNA ligase [Alphaproteobacteria bacterium]
MHKHRTHNCSELSPKEVGQQARLTGWVSRRRDHGGVLFLDLRDHYGSTQCVFRSQSPHFSRAESIRMESVITVTGSVVKRSPETINANIPTGEVELVVEDMLVVTESAYIPFSIGDESDEASDSLRLQYRFLDLRRTKMQNNIKFRHKSLQSIRNHMGKQGFLEIQTPILTASSPEGSRDFLIPSRLHPGKFYALPQAPQIYKQLLMTSGFDKYFQIAACFRDEDARADRAPGEFYQLDMEMSFVEQADVHHAIETLVDGWFSELATSTFDKPPFQHITHKEAMDKYGSDKPDLRNPLIIQNATSCFEKSGFKIFAQTIEKGGIVLGIVVPNVASKPRSFFDKMNDWARENGAPGLGYIIYDNELKGPIANTLEKERHDHIIKTLSLKDGDAAFFICSTNHFWAKDFAGKVRLELGERADLVDKNAIRICWIVDFPLYESGETWFSAWREPTPEERKTIYFSHNPFSMPQCDPEEFSSLDPLSLNAWQYDLVCNGMELGSGAIRNHHPELLVKCFQVPGYTEAQVRQDFKSLLSAFSYGAPPHGGCALGVDRIIMMLANMHNIREIIAFPKNQNAMDVLLGAPNNVPEQLLKDVFIKSTAKK